MEQKLTELVRRLKNALGNDLKAVVLYGSAVTGEFHSKHSDLNILCIVERAGSGELERLHPAVRWWTGQGNPAPMFFTFDELRHSADVFAIELVDIKLHHRMLLGDDFFEQFEVPLRLHALQLERELRTNWIRLREAVVAAPQKKRAHLAIMLGSVSTFCALFRHALWALGNPMPASKREAVGGVASLTGGNPSAFQAILELREGKRKPRHIDIEETLHAYLELVEVVTNEVDRRLESAMS
jgi:predicted nucleotidyltransferase